MKLIFIPFILLFFSSAQSQQFFQKSLGGSGSEAVSAMVKTTDGGLIMAGSTTTFGQDSGDVYVIKMNSAGALQWTRTIGGPSLDRASDIIQTSDGGYVITGRTGYWEFGIYAVKLDSLGNLQWSKKIYYGLFDQGHAIIQTADGGYAIAGSGFEPSISTYAGFLIKLNSTGTIQWKTYHNVFSDGAYSLVQASDLKYVIGGYSVASGGNLLISKVDSNGVVSWCRSIGGPGSEMARPGARLIRTNDNGYAYIGSTNSFGSGNNDMYILKLNTAGILQWSKAIGTANDDYGNSLVQTTDKGYIACGTSYNTNNTTDAYVAKLDSSGSLLWTNTFGGGDFEDANAIAQLNDGSIVIAGSTTSNGNGSEVYIVKMDTAGNACGNNTSSGNSSTGGVSNTVNYIGSPMNLTSANGPAGISNGGVLNTICNCTAPISFITSSALSVCSGDSIQLITNSTAGNSYKWLRNGNPINGAISPTYFTSTGGSYACIQSNACGIDTSNFVTITVKSLPSASITAAVSTICTGDSAQLNGIQSANRFYQWLRNGININGANSSTYFAKQNGNYRLQVSNTITGCTKLGNAITVNALPLPPASVTALGPTTFCAGGSVTLQANSGVGLTYQWRKNGSPISGASSINYTATTAGTYKVDVTNTKGCTKKSGNITITVPCREGELLQETTINMYPNPTYGPFKIQIVNESSQMTDIRIYDQVGREILCRHESIDLIDIDLSKMNDGIYNVHVINGEYLFRKTIAKISDK